MIAWSTSSGAAQRLGRLAAKTPARPERTNSTTKDVNGAGYADEVLHDALELLVDRIRVLAAGPRSRPGRAGASATSAAWAT